MNFHERELEKDNLEYFARLSLLEDNQNDFYRARQMSQRLEACWLAPNHLLEYREEVI
jgi:hypothetical protein